MGSTPPHFPLATWWIIELDFSALRGIAPPIFGSSGRLDKKQSRCSLNSWTPTFVRFRISLGKQLNSISFFPWASRVGFCTFYQLCHFQNLPTSDLHQVQVSRELSKHRWSCTFPIFAVPSSFSDALIFPNSSFLKPPESSPWSLSRVFQFSLALLLLLAPTAGCSNRCGVESKSSTCVLKTIPVCCKRFWTSSPTFASLLSRFSRCVHWTLHHFAWSLPGLLLILSLQYQYLHWNTGWFF